MLHASFLYRILKQTKMKNIVEKLMKFLTIHQLLDHKEVVVQIQKEICKIY